MALKVQIKHPTQGPDEEFAVPGAGMVKNGGSVTMNEDQERIFFSITGMHVRDYYKDSEMVTVTGTSEAKLPPNEVPAPNVNPNAVANEGSDS